MDVVLATLVGVGLAAACGFRVFVPMFVVSLAAKTGQVELASSFDWMGSNTAVVLFGVATGVEIAAYYVPWLDNLLDSIATPAAVVAGTVVTASFITDMDPALKWTLALIAGGGAAATVQFATVATRALSTVTTGGLGNPVVSTGEAAASTITSLLALLVPGLVLVLLVGAVLVVMMRRGRRRVATATGSAPAERGSRPVSPA